MVTTMALGAIKDTTEPAIRGREATHKHVIVVSWMRRPGGEMEAGWVRRHGGTGVAPDPPAPTGRDGPSQHPSESTSPPKKSELKVQRVVWGHPNRKNTLPHSQQTAPG